jgi:hypothetical protein
MADQYEPAIKLQPYDRNQGIDVAGIFKNRIDFENALMQTNQNRIAQWMQQGQMNALAPQQQGNPQAQAQQMGEQQAQAQAQQQQMQTLKSASDALASLRKIIGTKGIQDNWDTLKTLNPLFSQMQPGNLTDDGYIVKDKDGKELGRWVESPDGGAPHFLKTEKEPAGTETNYRQGLEKQMKKDHPGWSEDKVQFEAAAQVRKENAAEKKTEISLRFPTATESKTGVPGLVFDRRSGKYTWSKIPEGGEDTAKITDQSAAFKAKKTLVTDYARTSQVIRESQMDANTLLGRSSVFSRSNYPAPNKLITWTGEQAGSPKTQAEIGQFKIALLAFSRKYMRVVTGAARSVAELSVGAQDTAETVLNKFDSWTTLEAKVKQAQAEINNTDKSYKDELKALDDVISGKTTIGKPKEEEKKEVKATHKYIPGQGIVEIK